MATMESERTSNSRAELEAWYLRGLLPKLARAARTGVADAQAVRTLDADLRALLDIPRERVKAA